MKKFLLILLTTLFLSMIVLTILAQPLEPIQGAYAIAIGDQGEGWAKTGADGVFVIEEGLGEGTYTITIHAKGYISKSIKNVKVEANKETDLGDIVLEVSGKIIGKVVDPNGNPVKGVIVELYKGNQYINSTKTGADGSFVFDTDLDTGTYKVIARPFSAEGVKFKVINLGYQKVMIPLPGSVSVYSIGFTTGEKAGISVTKGKTTSNVVVQLGWSGIISGTVKDTNGNPIKDVVVIAYPPEEGYESGFYAVTDENGKYKIGNNLKSGEYNVTLLFPKGYVWNMFNAKKVKVEEGKETKNVDFVLKKSGIISGEVVYSDGRPAAFVNVMAFSSDGKYFGFATTDINGKFTIDSGLDTGDYQVVAISGTAFSNPVNVHVEAGKETKGVKLTIQGAGESAAKITGVVQDETGKPVPYATVTAGGNTTQTDANGNYEITVKFTGAKAQVALTASKRGYNSTTVNIQVNAGETVQKVVVIKKLPWGKLRGRVLGKVPVEAVKPTINLKLSAEKVSVGDTVTLSGTIQPFKGDTDIIIKITNPSGTKTKTLKTSNGAFSYTFTADVKGTWNIEVKIPQSTYYLEATASTTLTVEEVKPVKPTINLQLSATKVKVGDTVTVSGSIQPFKGETNVIIKITSPSGTETHTVKTSNGAFSYTFKANVKGTWNIEVKVPKGKYYLEATKTATLTVEEVQKKKCIIATVTFGSELAPEVQFLRGFRDNLILATRSGSAFYIAFDAFYYSWSTSVAKFIEEHAWLKTPVKAMIYPLIGVLELTAYIAIPLFSINSEFAAIFAGFIASSLLGLVYLTPPLLIAKFIYRRRGKELKISRKYLKTIGLITLASLVLIVLGLALNIVPLLVFSTSSYVVSLIILAPLSALSFFSKNFKK